MFVVNDPGEEGGSVGAASVRSLCPPGTGAVDSGRSTYGAGFPLWIRAATNTGLLRSSLFFSHWGPINMPPLWGSVSCGTSILYRHRRS